MATSPPAAPTTLGNMTESASIHNTIKRHPLPEIVRAFKSFSSRQINQRRTTPGTPVWQRNYYEHIVRDEEDLNRCRNYIANNLNRRNKDRFRRR
jgi:REP element-mobilizing transposase RayT